MSSVPPILTTVLLVEDNSADASVIQAALAGAMDRRMFCVEWVTHRAAALARLGAGGVDVILLVLTLPDGHGITMFEQISRAAPQALILILSSASDEDTARQAVRLGAHDYLVKGHVDAHWLPRALHYLIERKATQDALESSEARFRAMSDASPLGIFVSDAKGECIYTNAAYHKISGLTFERTLGTNWSMAIHPEDRARVLDEWRGAARGQVPFQTEFRFLQEDATIVSAVIGMGRNLKQRVIAEGIETEVQLAFLQARQCDCGQGYLFSRPLSAENFAPWLARESNEVPGQ